jgi:signal transduction histidine kinase
MYKSIRKLDNFIIDIINLSKNARLDLQVEPVEFDKLINTILEEHSFIENFKTIEFIIEVKQAGNFFTDSKRLTIVLNNLISNAIRYSRMQQPFVKIQVQADGDRAIIEISDNGIGIAQEHIDKIFNMFYRASQTKAGSGLGLYIVKETIQKLKGTIQVQSKIEHGSSFVIQIPAINQVALQENKKLISSEKLYR